MSDKNLIKEIVQGILDFKVIPFFGAGMSKPFGFKDWDELIMEMRRELKIDEKNNLRVAQFYEDKFGRNHLIDKLKESYKINNIEALLTDNHQLILAMAPPIIYTTNYDEGIEQTAKLIRRDYSKIASLRDIVQMPHGVNIIVKFHGDFSAEQEIVITEKDYERRMTAENPLDIIFRSHLLGKSMFFMGYGLRDKNIDFIFKKHSSLYGKENLPPSYIVVFKDNFSLEKQSEFQQKNIHTILLDSPEELHEILKEVNEEVYKGDLKRQSERMFQSFPRQVLLTQELDNLQEYWKSTAFTPLQKAEKTEETLELKLIPETQQQRVTDLLKQIFEDNSITDEAIEILLRTLNWTDIDPKLNLETGIALVALTERPYFQRSLSGFQILDPLQTLEKVFKNVGTVLCIFTYLVKCYQTKKVLSQPQLNDIDYVLRACKYDTYDFGEKLTKEMREELLDYFYSKYSGWRPARIFSKPSSLNDITEGLSKMMSKKFKERF